MFIFIIMTLFKHKPNKLKYLSNVRTLDEIHKSHIKMFQEQQKQLPKKKKQLKKIRNKLSELTNKNNTMTTIEFNKKANVLKERIKKLENEISDSEGNPGLMEYLSKTSDILINYYDVTIGTQYNSTQSIDYSEHTRTNDEQSKQTEEELQLSEKLKILNKISRSKRKIRKPIRKRKNLRHDIDSKSSILQFITENQHETQEETKSINRAKLLDTYLTIVLPDYACDKSKRNNPHFCTKCGIEKTLFQSEGSYICQSCGEVEEILIESEVPNHKEIINEKTKYPYKKINHLKEKLNQFQSKESVEIPDSIYNIINSELKKKRINPLKSTPNDIKKILKKRRLTDYYEHLQQIYCKVSLSKPISLTRNIEEKIECMFKDMQESFQKHCPQNRSNFLNYSYVLNKIFLILHMPIHASYFGLLKSSNKLYEQDVIWNKICNDMGWEFFSSFKIH